MSFNHDRFHPTLNSLINKQTRRNEYGGKIFFIYFMNIESMMANFSHLLHEKLKVRWIFFPKKLSDHAHLLGTSEYAN